MGTFGVTTMDGAEGSGTDWGRTGTGCTNKRGTDWECIGTDCTDCIDEGGGTAGADAVSRGVDVIVEGIVVSLSLVRGPVIISNIELLDG